MIEFLIIFRYNFIALWHSSACCGCRAIDFIKQTRLLLRSNERQKREEIQLSWQMVEEYKRRYLRNTIISSLDVPTHKSFNFYSLIGSRYVRASLLFITIRSICHRLYHRLKFHRFIASACSLTARAVALNLILNSQAFLMAIMRRFFMVVMDVSPPPFNRHIFLMTSNCIRSLYGKEKRGLSVYWMNLSLWHPLAFKHFMTCWGFFSTL